MDIIEHEGDPVVSAFREGISGGRRPEYKDPMADKYFGANPPKWAHHAWHGIDGYSNEYTGRVVNPTEEAQRRKEFFEEMDVNFTPEPGLLGRGAECAAVGAKGSGKSFTFGMACNSRIQEHAGIKIGLAANSYDQAYGSGAEKLTKVARAMGINFIHRGEMVIDDFKHRNVYYFPAFNAKVCVLSFDNIDLIEGTEWDGFWFEEIQDCKQRDVQTAISRARRGVCAPFFYFAGMPDDTGHWMYSFFEERGIPIFEPPFYENEHNVEPTYKAQLKRNYRGSDVERYLEGKRVALFKQRVIPNMRWPLHVQGRHETVGNGATLTERMCNYDPYRKLFLTIDFNVAPMCMSAWQVKEWDFARPNSPDTNVKNVLCQVDEFELWGATTGDMMDAFMQKYGDHHAGGVILGDATGNRRDTRSPSDTDWKIIKRKLSSLRNFAVVPGLQRTRRKKRKRGESLLTYSNPPVRETINRLNNFMIDGEGDPRILFLPESGLASGGAAKSVHDAEYDMLSRVDATNDKSDDRTLPRTHCFDGVRYIVWWMHGKYILPDPKEDKNKMQNAQSGR